MASKRARLNVIGMFAVGRLCLFLKIESHFFMRWLIHLVISYREVSRYSFQKPVKDRFIVSDILFKKQFIIMFLEPIVFRLSRIQLDQKKFNFEFQNLGQ